MKRNPLLLILLLLVAAIAVGDCFLPYGPFRSAPSWPNEARTWEGVVTQQPKVLGKTTRAVVRLTDGEALVQLTVANGTTAAVDGTTVPSVSPEGATAAAVDAIPAPSASPEGATQAFHVGDLVAFHGRIEEPRNAGNPGEMDYAAYLRHQGISGQTFCYAQQWRNIGPASSLTLTERMLKVRDRLTGTLALHLEGTTLAIVSAMALGDRSMVDNSVRELYNRSGNSHILALSGLHLSILFSVLAFVLLRPLRRWGRVGQLAGGAISLFVLWAFVLLAGLPVSLVRAATMLTIVTLLQMLRRTPPPLHSLIVALIVMLLWRPQMLFDVGLQLSAVAVAAIIVVSHAVSRATSIAYLATPWQIRRYAKQVMETTQTSRLGDVARRMARGVAMLLLVSLTAQMATMPLVAHYFGRVALGGWISSLVVIPAAYCILLGAVLYLLLAALPAVWGTAAAAGLAKVLTAVVGAVHAVLGMVAEWPMATFHVDLTWWGVAGCYLLIIWMAYSAEQCVSLKASILQLRSRRMALTFRNAAVALLLVLLTVGGEKLLDVLRRPVSSVVIYNRPNRTEIHCVTATTDSIVTQDSPYMVGSVLAFAGQKVAVVRAPLPYVGDIEMPDPLDVDALLIARGAKGHLHDMLLRYRPALVVLDGSLTDYYRTRFAEEAAAAGLPLYDVRQQGALSLCAGGDNVKD